MRKVALLLALAGCPSRAPSPASDAGPAASASLAGGATVKDAAAPTEAVAARAWLADAGTATVPYVSKQGLFSASVPADAKPYETTSGVAWSLAGATLAVSYYDGKPRGVDRSGQYDLARDMVNGSALEKEEDVKLSGFPTRLRRMRVVPVGRPVLFRRSAIVVDGDRTFDVSCSSPAREDLDAPLCQALFATFLAVASKPAPRH